MQLTCTCENMESAASLDLKMSYYVFQRSPNIRMVYIQHCSELYVRLDFRGVDSTNFPVYFRSLQKLHIGKDRILTILHSAPWVHFLFKDQILMKTIKNSCKMAKLRKLNKKFWNFELKKRFNYLNFKVWISQKFIFLLCSNYNFWF